MKQILLFVLFTGIFAGRPFCQEQKPPEPAKDSLQYKLYPSLPAFNIRQLDSFTVFNTFNIPKGRPSVLLFFDPDCAHCQKLTKILLSGMDSLSNIDFYFITPVHSMTLLRNFNTEYHLADFKNIKVVGRDYEFFYSDFFDIRSVPDVALYDEKKMFVRLWEGNVKVRELYEYTHK